MVSDDRFAVRRFSDDFASILRERIFSGELKWGERLNEVHLSTEYGISRSPIREALQALSGEGLVVFVPGKGAFIGGQSAESVAELGQLREALESHATRLVAENAGDDEIAELVRATGVTPEGESGGPYPPGHVDFHAQILALSGNARLMQLTNSIIGQLRLARSQSATRPGRTEEAAEEHQTIVAALEKRDADGASAAMRAHIRQATENSLAALAAADS